MKKLFSFLLIFVLTLTSVVAFAEEDTNELNFSIRNGIQFGMNVDEVRQVEIDAGNTVSDEELSYTFFDENGIYMMKPTVGLTVTGSMAGIDNSKLYYYFDEKGKLFSAVYSFGKPSRTDYVDIQNLLDEKYANDWTIASETVPSNIDYFWDVKIDPTLTCQDNNYLQMSNGDRIYVNHALFHDDYLPGNYSEAVLLQLDGFHLLEYRFISNDELNKIQSAIGTKEQRENEAQKAEEAEIERQRNDDL